MEFYGVIHPDFKAFYRLRSTQYTGYERYFAFPAILRLDDDTVLIAHKNGLGHADDKGARATLDQLTLDLKTNKLSKIETLYSKEGMVPQMGEYVKMPNGDICLYIDMQSPEAHGRRTGMEVLRSKDGANTWTDAARVGEIDGVEYGYPLDSCEKNGRVYMLAMTFAYLTGSENRRQVHVISSADSGRTWRFEANLTKILGIEFNESALIAVDGGFMLATRGESARHIENTGSDAEAPACVYALSDRFEVLRARDYRHTRCDMSQFGRPRLYMYQGKLMLITRQHIQTGEGVRMCLDLFAIDPDTLEIVSRARLSDPFMANQDGHYASLVLDNAGLCPRLYAVDYLTCLTPANPSVSRKTDIVLMGFDVNALKAQHKEATGIDF